EVGLLAIHSLPVVLKLRLFSQQTVVKAIALFFQKFNFLLRVRRWLSRSNGLGNLLFRTAITGLTAAIFRDTAFVFVVFSHRTHYKVIPSRRLPSYVRIVGWLVPLPP